ncbi:MAG: NTP transferase domain-containing protein [Myxococcales bacterium]|nr:NTP transferase domain-containing protein [Myxococcales bacterium]
MRIGAVVLAAGAGARLGGVAKALVPLDGVTFLARIVATAGAAGVAPADVIVVVGPPHQAAVAAAAAALGATVVVNPAPARGMASSVALGFAALAPAIDAALLWPVDHPWVRATTLAALRARGEGVPVHDGRRGHPPLVGRARFAALAAAAAHPDGARGVLRGALPLIDVIDPGVVRDVDHPHDLPEAACGA